MKTTSIKLGSLIRESLSEAHERGEWWIDDVGELKKYRDPGYYADEDLMQHENWKKMKALDDKIEITTWDFRSEDLRIIIQGIRKIMGVEPTEKDPDAIVGKDGYTGPRIDLTLAKKKRTFKNVPLAILEKCLPSNLKNYGNGKPSELPEPVNEEYHHLHKDYRLYEGDKHIVAIFEDNSRLVFEVHYHDKHGEDRDKWRRQAFSKWKSVANEIHSDVQLTEVGNPIQKTWKECFQEALKHPKLKDYIRMPHHQKVFDDNGHSK